MEGSLEEATNAAAACTVLALAAALVGGIVGFATNEWAPTAVLLIGSATASIGALFYFGEMIFRLEREDGW